MIYKCEYCGRHSMPMRRLRHPAGRNARPRVVCIDSQECNEFSAGYAAARTIPATLINTPQSHISEERGI